MAEETIFGIDLGTDVSFAYAGTGDIIFGAEYANQDFLVPLAKFTFYDAFGNSLSDTAPTIYIRMPGTFNTSLINGYQPITGIFGRPSLDEVNAVFTDKLSQLGDAAITSLQKQIVSAAAGGIGYAASAGNSGKAQVEFLQRKLLNSFQQLIYQGPTFRRFQIPFIMKPSDINEATYMRAIIHNFRYASSPRIDTNTLVNSDSSSIDFLALSTPEENNNENAQAAAEAAAQAVLFTQEEAAQLAQLSGSVLAFGYPDLCRLELVLGQTGLSAIKDRNGNETGGESLNITSLVPVFKSDYCVIESVAVDYGAQNKMTFLNAKDAGGEDGDYVPSEVTMTISLQEINLITANKVARDYHNNKMIIL